MFLLNRRTSTSFYPFLTSFYPKNFSFFFFIRSFSFKLRPICFSSVTEALCHYKTMTQIHKVTLLLKPTFYLILLLLLLFWFPCLISGLTQDGEALLSLFKKWVPPSSFKSNWNSSDSTPCGWLRIRCDPKNNVIALNLTSYGFSGELGPEIGKLEIHSIH